jgi:hypothetical protein
LPHGNPFFLAVRTRPITDALTAPRRRAGPAQCAFAAAVRLSASLRTHR